MSRFVLVGALVSFWGVGGRCTGARGDEFFTTHTEQLFGDRALTPGQYIAPADNCGCCVRFFGFQSSRG